MAVNTDCPHCGKHIKAAIIKSWNGQLIQSRRVEFKGPPKRMRRCRYCRQPFSAQELRVHMPRCPKRPADPNPKQGRPKVLRTCRWCKEQFGYAEMAVHRPVCPKRPQ